MEVTNKNELGLTLLTFKQYSQQQSEIASKKEVKAPVPTEYQQLIDSHPEILKINFVDKQLHGVIHDIPTSNNKQCRATMRPIAHGTQKAIDAEKTWKELEKNGSSHQS